jgi:hypothetical protein
LTKQQQQKPLLAVSRSYWITNPSLWLVACFRWLKAFGRGLPHRNLLVMLIELAGVELKLLMVIMEGDREKCLF